MGCFLGCFGFSKKRKHRKPPKKLLYGDQRHGNYETLDSSVSLNLDITENPIGLDSELSSKPKLRSSIKIRKKVSFNLNVKAYEPIPNDETAYKFLESEEEEKEKINGEETAKGSLCPLSLGDSIASKMRSYPSNYRYKNCRDSFEEEDEAGYESDLNDDDDDDDDDDEDDDDDSDIDDQKISQEEYSKQFCSLSMSSQNRVAFTQLSEEKTNNVIPHCASADGELKSTGLGRNARDRSQYVHSVLNPVENLTQWKAIKARAAPPKHQRKENIALKQEQQIPFSSKPSSNIAPNYIQSKPLLQEIAVDSSLSNWLASPNPNKLQSTGITKNSSIAVESMASKKSTFDRSCSC